MVCAVCLGPYGRREAGLVGDGRLREQRVPFSNEVQSGRDCRLHLQEMSLLQHPLLSVLMNRFSLEFNAFIGEKNREFALLTYVVIALFSFYHCAQGIDPQM